MSPAVAALIIFVSWELFRVSSRKQIDRRVLLIAGLSAIAFWYEIPSPIVLLCAGILGVILFGRRRF
jgi:chromate transport protein ChrA